MIFRWLGFLIIASLLLGSVDRLMAQVIISNKPSTKVAMLPLDAAHRGQAASGLVQVYDRLPSGSFLLQNLTSAPINAVVSTWDYLNEQGQPEQARLNCDGYLLGAINPIVEPNSTTLVTPYGCAGEQLFPRLATGALLGSPLVPVRRQFQPDVRSPIRVSVDSIIFANGDIWGPDTLRYFTGIQARYSELEQLMLDIDAVRSSQADLPTILSRIDQDSTVVADAHPRRKYFVKLLRLSPNPEKTLEQMKTHSRPPVFHHIGEL